MVVDVAGWFGGNVADETGDVFVEGAEGGEFCVGVEEGDSEDVAGRVSTMPSR